MYRQGRQRKEEKEECITEEEKEVEDLKRRERKRTKDKSRSKEGKLKYIEHLLSAPVTARTGHLT
jgi:hypothetical protein